MTAQGKVETSKIDKLHKDIESINEDLYNKEERHPPVVL